MLAASYLQIHLDLADDSRQSYKGTANELRETLRAALELLAPDGDVKRQPWYQNDAKKTHPTHRERARYALERRGASGSLDLQSQAIVTIEEGVAQLARELYTSASAAAHVGQEREAIRRLLGYLNPLLSDLCG